MPHGLPRLAVIGTAVMTAAANSQLPARRVSEVINWQQTARALMSPVNTWEAAMSHPS